MRTDTFDATYQASESTDGTSEINTTMGQMAAGPSSVATKGVLVQDLLEVDAASCGPKARFTRAKFMLQAQLPDYVLYVGSYARIRTQLSTRLHRKGVNHQ